jgi:F-type H+-transporting ATPase subunit gamma
MAKARSLDKRRKAVRNIRKITRTMELIANARFKKAMDRAVAASEFARRVTELLAAVKRTGVAVEHALLQPHPTTKRTVLLVLTANRGLCGGYNAGVMRVATAHWQALKPAVEKIDVEVAGKRGISGLKYRGVRLDQTYTQFGDEPKFADVDVIAECYLDSFAQHTIDRVDVAYTKFINAARQVAVVETLLPLGSLLEERPTRKVAGGVDASAAPASELQYDFLPSVKSILQEVVPACFKVRLFKCFLDAAVSEHIARMTAMKAATENASEMIKRLSIAYNRARQSQITNEIMEIIGGAEALNE